MCIRDRVKDVSGRNGKVLETFVEAGADASILYDSRPHIGTDVLREVVKNIRKRIQDAGGEAVSYTHLDVYKRQGKWWMWPSETAVLWR